MNEGSLPERKQENPFTATYSSVQEWCEAMERQDKDFHVHNTKVLIERPAGKLVSCTGDDGQFYVLLEKGGQVRYLHTADNFKDATNLADSEKNKLL